jgi:hypothetical protein
LLSCCHFRSPLFKVGGGTIWAPAVLHFIVQATVQDSRGVTGYGIVRAGLMLASAVVPLVSFIVPQPVSVAQRRSATQP